MKTDWLKKNGYYEIKGNPPYMEQGEYRVKYFSDKCLVGLHAKQLKKLLGKPNQTPLQKGWELYIYCLNEDCSQKFQVILDSSSYVKSAILKPGEIIKG